MCMAGVGATTNGETLAHMYSDVFFGTFNAMAQYFVGYGTTCFISIKLEMDKFWIAQEPMGKEKGRKHIFPAVRSGLPAM